MKKIIISSFFALSAIYAFFGLQPAVFAKGKPSPVKTRLYDLYTLTNSSTVVVERTITLTNTVPDLYVKQYSFSFYESQGVANISVYEDGKKADYTSKRDGGARRITVTFSNPAVGIGAKKVLKITYSLSEYLKDFGIHKELVVSPSNLSENESIESYDIDVVVPESYPALGLSKPKIQAVSNTKYRWSNIDISSSNRNYYVSFGNVSYYSVELQYSLKNSYPYAQKFTIPFVPDGAYQKAYIESISPQPESVIIDDDNNYLGIYTVEGNEVRNIVYKGVVVLSNDIRPEVRSYFQKKYSRNDLSRYLTQEKYWSLPNGDWKFNNAKGIYDFVVNNLSYDNNRINISLKRMGAQWIINNPQNAVCMEYTDLFIALARENGIAAREVVGYGVTADKSLFPISFFGDILHAWPEYFDKAREIWKPVDPTWGDTANIDYFSTLDLNHIAFVYHGKSALSPLPPGVYKTRSNKKDVYINPAYSIPQEDTEIQVIAPNRIIMLPKKNNNEIILASKANVMLYNVAVEISDKKGILLHKQTIDALAPFQSVPISIAKSMHTSWQSSGVLNIKINGQKIASRQYTAYASWFYYLMGNKLLTYSVLGLVIFAVVFVIQLRR